MEIKLIALDMDGTVLLDDFRSISKRNKEALEAAIKQGLIVVPASGRISGQIPASIREIEGIRYLITSNGAIVVDLQEDRLIAANYIGAGTIKKLVSVLNRKKLFYGIYHQGENYIQKDLFDKIENGERFDQGHYEFVKTASLYVDSIFDFALGHAGEIEKVDIPFLTDNNLSVLWQKFSRYKGVSLTSPIENTIEVSHRTSNKGEGLKKLCRELKIKPQQVMAIGDSDNDLEMFKVAGFPVAMENATPELKALARVETASYLDDGVAQVIEKYILSGWQKN